jgi:hypothetical protein
VIRVICSILVFLAFASAAAEFTRRLVPAIPNPLVVTGAVLFVAVASPGTTLVVITLLACAVVGSHFVRGADRH